MRKEEFCEIIESINEKHIMEARADYKVKKPVLLKWGAIAVCLCLIAVGSVMLTHQKSPTFEVGVGGETGSYSIAVHPASETIENVDSAEVVSLSENEALNNELAVYLPKQLPNGFYYGRGSVYNTTMKNGTKYSMLRIEYISGKIPEQQFAEDGGAIAPDVDTVGDFFTICVMNYEPKTEQKIYSSIDEISVGILDENDFVYIFLENCYISISTETADPGAVFQAVENIR